VLVALALAAALAAAEPPTPPPAGGPHGPAVTIGEEERLERRLAFVPLASFGSNVGLQLGAALLLYRTPEGGGPRRDWIAAGASWATRGPRSVEVKGDGLLARRLRTFYQAKYTVDGD
jgi:hypothetical protein